MNQIQKTEGGFDIRAVINRGKQSPNIIANGVAHTADFLIGTVNILGAVEVEEYNKTEAVVKNVIKELKRR